MEFESVPQACNPYHSVNTVMWQEELWYDKINDLEKLIKATGREPEEEKGDIDMPTISMFYGIIIYMYYFDNKEHQTPHIHANYAEHDAVISIPEGDVLKGEMPNKKLKLIKAWIEIHQEDLTADWKLAVEGQQPYKIKPLR